MNGRARPAGLRTVGVPAARVLAAGVLAAAVLAAGVLAAAPAVAAAGAAVPGAVGGDLRVVHADAGAAVTRLGAVLDGDRRSEVAWGGAGPWWHVASGRHAVAVTTAGRTLQATVAVCPGCLVSVVAVQTDAADAASVRLLTFTTPPGPRIPEGMARLDAVIHAEPDSGPVRVDTAGQSAGVAFLGHAGPFDVVAGAVAVRVLGPASGQEVYAGIAPVLAAGTSHTVLWLGGGETPARLVVLDDAAQSPTALPAGLPVNTGLPVGDLLGPALPAAVVLGTVLVLHRRLRRGAALLGVAAVLLTAGCAATGPAGDAGAGPAGQLPVSVLPSSGSGTSGSGTSRSGTSLAAAPARLEIAALRLDRRLLTFHLDDVALLPRSLPRDGVAWLSGSATPGSRGAALVLGHHNSTDTGAFARLGTLRPGQPVVVVDAAGVPHLFVVAYAVTVPKGQLPDWLWAPQAHPTLALLTCDGRRDPRTRMPADNLLVWAVAADA